MAKRAKTISVRVPADLVELLDGDVLEGRTLVLEDVNYIDGVVTLIARPTP